MIERMGQPDSKSDKMPDPMAKADFNAVSTNSFYMHFIPGMFGEVYRRADHYKALAKQRPDLHERLTKAFDFIAPQKSVGDPRSAPKDAADADQARSRRIVETFETNKDDLYEAYLIMRTAAGDDQTVFA